MLVEIHDGWCRSHIGARSLAIKVTRVDYYWPTLVKDSPRIREKRRCRAGQGNSPQFPTSTLTPVPKGGALNCLSLVLIISRTDRNPPPIKKTKGENVTHFLWKNILTRFGIPKILVYDNAPQLEGQILADFLVEQFELSMYSTVWLSSIKRR
ncbi:hypothetical protein Leryth_023138 [Lithospermum erythrorhizon]|nr:hypothetical protein Leryth_023138 [Lithospermum erythrorhizon]